MKTMFSFFCCLLIGNGALHAQNWLTQDAIWHYDFGNTNAGYKALQYTSDTVVGGRTAQKLTSSHIHQNQVTGVWETGADTSFTNFQDSIVFLWANQAGIWSWDTLYLFNGVPGDRWWPIQGENSCPAPWGMLEVQDTSTTMINGVPLRTWCVAYLDEAGEPADPGCFEVYERIGSTAGLVPLPNGCIATETWECLRCYADVEMPLYETGIAPSCNFILEVDDLRGPGRFSLSPNPGTDHFYVTSSGFKGHLYLFDATGRTIRSTPLGGDRTLIDASSLASGLYGYRAVDRSGRLQAAGLWVKE